MTVEQIPFEQVFDGSDSFAPAAIIGLDLRLFAASRHLKEVPGEDGLDAYMAIPMRMTGPGGDTLSFALWRHAGSPEGTFAIHLPVARLGEPGVLEPVFRELRIPEAAVLWRELDRRVPSPPLEQPVTARWERVRA